MIVKSFMSLEDLIDPSIKWLPSTLVVSNYTKAIEVLKFGDALKDSIIVSLVPTICAVISSMLIAYGFAHFKFPGKNILFGILIFVFLIPYSASVYNGLSSLFEIVFGIQGWIIMIALALLTALYLFFGGYFATALF